MGAIETLKGVFRRPSPMEAHREIGRKEEPQESPIEASSFGEFVDLLRSGKHTRVTGNVYTESVREDDEYKGERYATMFRARNVYGEQLVFKEVYGMFTDEEMGDAYLRTFLTTEHRLKMLQDDEHVYVSFVDGSYPNPREIDLFMWSHLQEQAVKAGITEPFPIAEAI